MIEATTTPMLPGENCSPNPAVPRNLLEAVGSAVLEHCRHPAMWELLVPLTEAYLNLMRADEIRRGMQR